MPYLLLEFLVTDATTALSKSKKSTVLQMGTIALICPLHQCHLTWLVSLESNILKSPSDRDAYTKLSRKIPLKIKILPSGSTTHLDLLTNAAILINLREIAPKRLWIPWVSILKL